MPAPEFFFTLYVRRDVDYIVSTVDGFIWEERARFAGDDIPSGSYCHVWWLYSARKYVKVDKGDYTNILRI